MFKPSSSKNLLSLSSVLQFLKMSKGKTLTGIERGRILELYKQNLSQRVNTSEISRS